MRIRPCTLAMASLRTEVTNGKVCQAFISGVKRSVRHPEEFAKFFGAILK